MKKLYLVGNSHIDPVWLWRWQEGFSEILATWRSALDRMKEFPDFKFASACACYYQWVEKMDPEMFAEIQQRVTEGRWNIVGGWFLQPDCNIPCGESFARHGLISQRYFKEKFGITAKTGYNVDSFGHNASLPKILKSSNMENYVFARPSEEEMPTGQYRFIWESDDGSKVCGYKIPWGYGLRELELLLQAKKQTEEDDVDYMLFYGIGNHGGGPTIEFLSEIEALRTPEMGYATVDEYFAALDKKELVTIKGELQHHARGCYSAGAMVKQMNRACEKNILAAEKLSVMANAIVGSPYPKEKLKKAWENILFNQFHDVLGGCSIKSAYTDASYLFGETMAITEQIIYAAMQKIGRAIDTLQGEELPSYKKPKWRLWQHEVLGTPIVVFNPHPWPSCAPVKISPLATKVTDEKNHEILFQTVRAEQTINHDKNNTLFFAELEPFGYRVYRAFSEALPKKDGENTLNITVHSLENDKIKVEFDSLTGEISKFYSKTSQEYIINAACKTILLDETECDTWAHGKDKLGEYVGAFGSAQFKVIEEGPVRATLMVTSFYEKSTLIRYYSIVHDSDMLVVQTKIDFHEKHRTLKLAFPTKGNDILSEIPYGCTIRPQNTGEEFCHSWIATDRLCIANDSKYAYDTEDNFLRLTVLRSAIYAEHEPLVNGDRDDLSEYMEQGYHEFTYSIFPYTSKAEASRKAEEIHMPLLSLAESFHSGYLPEKQSCFSCDNKDVVVTAIKQHEDSEGNVLRFYEMEGNGGNVSLKLFDKEIHTNVSPYQIKTVLDNGEEVNLLEWQEVREEL